MLRVDQAGVRQRSVWRARCVDPLGGVCGLDVESNGDNGETECCEFSVECLPPGQAGATASIAGPGDQQYLSTVQRGEAERLPVVSDKCRVGGGGGGESLAAQCGGA